MFFTLLSDFSWSFPNKVSLVTDGGAGLEPATVTRTIMDVVSWGKLAGSLTSGGEGAWYSPG